MAVGFSDPLGLIVTTDPANTAVYVSPPSGRGRGRFASCGLQLVRQGTQVKSPGRVADPVPGARRLLASWNESPELASSLAFRLPASWTDGPWEALNSTQGMVLRFPVVTTGFFFLRDFSAFVYSLRKAGESSSIDIASIKTNSSCLSMMLG